MRVTEQSESGLVDGRTSRATERRARTRQALLDAAVAICLAEGPPAVTTTRVARAAGLSQPAFYKYFDNVDACLEAVAGEAGRAVHARDREARKRMQLGDDARDNIREVYRAALGGILAEDTWARLYFRYRRDPTHAVGRQMALIEAESREQLTEDLRLAAQQLGFNEVPDIYLTPYAEILSGQMDGAAVALLDGRVADPALMVELLTEMTWGFLSRFVEAKRTGQEQP